MSETASLPLGSCQQLLDLIAEKGLIQAAMEHEAEHAAMRATNFGTLTFGLSVIVASVCVFLFLGRFTDKLWRRIAVMAIGVLIFEIFTAPMWINNSLGRWAYVYVDVSWILTLGWTAMILGVVVMVDHWFATWSAAKRFGVYVGVLLVLVLIAEIVVFNLGIRRYAPEVLESISGLRILGVPIEVFYYAPVFTSLIIAFYKYWIFLIDGVAMVPVKRRNWLRALVIGFIAVFMFELLIEPMVRNDNFPAWSYVYHDISFVMTCCWVVIIAVAALLTDRFLMGVPVPIRFGVALLVIGALMLPIESWLISNGYRVYGDSAVANFSGFTTPITGVAAEVAFAIPFYAALMVCFIRHWEIVLDNHL